MKLVTLKCPGCGATISLPENSKFGYCEYCDSQLRFDDGTRSIEIHNEAQELRNKINREELEKQKIAHEAFENRLAVQKKKRLIWRFVCAGCALVFYLFILLMAYIGYDGGENIMKKLILIFMGYFLFMPIIINIFRPHVPRNEFDKADTGKIKSMLLTWLLYFGMIFLAAITFAVVMIFKGM